MAIPILQTKLSPPELRQDHIHRPLLVHRLHASQDKKLTALVASAGYGKSSLLAEWVNTLPEQIRFVWYSLDAGDQDPVVFFSYLITGLRENWPGFGTELEATLNRPTPLNAEQVAISLLGELENTLQQRTLIIILEDYYLLSNPHQIDLIISHLLTYLPKDVRLVVSSRQPLTFAIAKLRSQDQILELRERELRFTLEDIQRMFAPERLPTALQNLIQRTEGWVTGLQLIRQVYLQSPPGVLDQIMSGGQDWTGNIFDYLAEEVFERQPPSLQVFLKQTSILDTLVPADCDAIFERADSAKWLSHLVNQGLYTVLLTRNPETYRYHHLLSDFLRQKLSLETTPAQLQDLHCRAAKYFQAAYRWSDAFGQAIQADQALAAEILLQAAPGMRLAGQSSTLQLWLDQFPAAAYLVHPFLFAWQGFIWADQGQLEKAKGSFQQAIDNAETSQDRRSLYSGWVGLGIVHQRSGDLDKSRMAWEKAVEYAQLGGSPQEQATALNGLALIHIYTARNPQALEIHHRCLELVVNLSKPMHALVVQNIGTVLTYMGQIRQALFYYEESLKLREESNTRPGIANSLNNIGRNQVLLGDLGAAEKNIQRAMTIYQELENPLWYSYALSNLGELAAARGELNQAEALYHQSIAIKEQQHDSLGLQHTWALLSDLRRLQGDAEGAEYIAHQALEAAKASAGTNETILAQTALALAHLSGGKAEAAIPQLNHIIAQHRTQTQNNHQLVRCLWYLANAQLQIKQDGCPVLAEALELAERWEYHFLITKLSQELPELLACAVREDLQPTFLSRVLVRLGEDAVPALRLVLAEPDPNIRQRAIARLAELGTDGVWSLLWQAAESDKHELVKAQAKTALASLGKATPPPLRVTTLGRFTLQNSQREVTATDWGYNRKAQSVFKILLSHAGQPVSRETIIELLWPETTFATLEKTNHTLNQAVSALRKVLEPYLPPHYPSRYLLSDNETYCLRLPPGSWVDFQALEDSMRLAKAAQRKGNQAEMIRHYQAASELYTGDYLVEESRLDWPLAHQDRLKRQIIDALEALARLHLERNDPLQAADQAERLLSIDAQHEPGYLLLMRAQVAMGQGKEALRTYKRYLKNCVEALDFPIDPKIQQLYLWIMEQLNKKGNPPDP